MNADKRAPIQLTRCAQVRRIGGPIARVRAGAPARRKTYGTRAISGMLGANQSKVGRVFEALNAAPVGCHGIPVR